MGKDPAVSLYRLSSEDHTAFFMGLVQKNAPYNLVYDRERVVASQ